MEPLISVDKALELLQSGERVTVLDCRASLSDGASGFSEWFAEHLPDSMHADLENELSMPGPATLGRHPLPDDVRLSQLFSHWSLTPDRWLLVHDAGDGAYAARAWWLASRAGHARTRVIDGGVRAWKEARHPMEQGKPAPAPAQGAPAVQVALDRAAIIGADELSAAIETNAVLLIDARSQVRFRGESEPIDAVAGHVPGARNRPYADNLQQGVFKSPQALCEEFSDLLEGVSPDRVVHMCGSGVTACHNLLAMDIAGLKGSRLFAPSWSGWTADASRDIAFGGANPLTPAL